MGSDRKLSQMAVDNETGTTNWKGSSTPSIQTLAKAGDRQALRLYEARALHKVV